MKNTNSLKRSYMINKALTYFFLILGAVIMIFPFLWMILTSSKTVPESMLIPPTFFQSSSYWIILKKRSPACRLPIYIGTRY